MITPSCLCIVSMLNGKFTYPFTKSQFFSYDRSHKKGLLLSCWFGHLHYNRVPSYFFISLSHMSCSLTVTGKCYQSNKRGYHQIRCQSDKQYKETNLSVIDEFYKSYKRKYKTNGKPWYENEQSKKGTSWKSRLQFDIVRLIKQSKDWEEFLKKMAELDYEIKYRKHIAFKPKIRRDLQGLRRLVRTIWRKD